MKEALIGKELTIKEKEKEALYRQTLKENSELKLLAKNRPGSSIGSDGGSIVEVKDNVFTVEQLAELKKKAIALKVDPEKFIEKAKQNLLNHR